MNLINGDCLEIMKDLSTNSIDIVIADLPYGRFEHLLWDTPNDLAKMWKELNRICKKTTPICLFGDMKFGVELINSNPKDFKYEIVWNKKQTTTPLLSRKRMGKATEYIFLFYRKQCCYNYSKYHKIKKRDVDQSHRIMGGAHMGGKKNYYEPKLPINVVTAKQPSFFFEENKKGSSNNHLVRKKVLYTPKLPINVVSSPLIMGSNKKFTHAKSGIYEPRLPINIIEGINCCNIPRKKRTIKYITEKPQFLLEFLLKYFSNEGDNCLDFTMGSGSCGVACKKLKRNFIGIEKFKEHYDKAKNRLS